MVTASSESASHAKPVYMSEAGQRLVDEFPDLYSEAIEVSVPPGWYDLVRALSQLVMDRAPEVRVRQCKEKMGLRWYASHSDPVDHFIAEAEQLSQCTCEQCGRGAMIRGWRVLCEGCAK